MRKLNSRRKILIITSLLALIVIIGIVSIKVINQIEIANNKYLANSGNANSQLVSSVIKKGITIGGIEGTLEVLDTSDATAEPKDIRKGQTAYVKGKKITGTKIERDMLQVGDTVEYYPDTAAAYKIESQHSGYSTTQTLTQEQFTWKIMSIDNDNGTIELIADTPATQTFRLIGGLGYNNAVYFMNDICKQFYSNSSLRIEGRALNKDDIHNNMSEEGIAARNEFKGSCGLHYGETMTFLYDREYPALLEKEKGIAIGNNEISQTGILPSDSYYDKPTIDNIKVTDSLVFPQTWYGGLRLVSSYFKNQEFFDLIFSGNENYSLASRQLYIFTQSNCEFQLAIVDVGGEDSYIGGDTFLHDMFETTASAYGDDIKYRPVVTLKSNIQFVDGDGSEENPYKIST